MKAILIVLNFLLLFPLFSFTQVKSKALKVYCITEYIDGYVIKAIDTSKLDTLNIISVKEVIKSNRNFKKLIVGKDYKFKYEDSKMAAMPTNNFVIRIRTTVVWRGTDDNKERPVFLKTLKGYG